MKQSLLNQELHLYGELLQTFVDTHQLPAEWFEAPDHFAIKCANFADYTETCQMMQPRADSEGLWEIQLDGRRLGSARLASSVLLAGHRFEWVEVMQPRPTKETSNAFVEHTEFFFPDFESVLKTLSAKGIAATIQKNPGHAWVNIVIDNNGRELKINDRPLRDVVVIEKAEGKLSKILL